MKTIHLLLLVLITVALSSCGTSFYGNDGKLVARFEGDMTKCEYQRACDGSMRWSADTVNHSSATIAGGNAISKGVISAGTSIATSGIPAIAK